MAFAAKLINISAAILLPASCSSPACCGSLNLVSLLAISSAIVSHVRKTMTSLRERKWWWWGWCWWCCWWRTAFNMVFLLVPPSSPSLPHPLHTHVSVAKFKQLLPANAFNGKTSFVAPNGAVAKVSFCLVSFRFCFGFFLFFSLLFASSNIHWVWVKGRCRGWGWGRGCCWCRHAAISLADSAPSPGQLHCHSHTESRPCRAYGARARARSSSHLNAHIISNLCS